VSAAAVALLAERPGVLAARQAARAARTDMEDEIERLEAALRAAVDVKAKVRRHPARAAGVAAGIGFLAVGGPRRALRRAREAVFGKPDPLPKAMLPDEIEKALKALGPDGAKVRGALERDFAGYLEKTAPKRRDLRSTLVFLLLPTARVLIQRFGRPVLEGEIFSPGAASPISWTGSGAPGRGDRGGEWRRGHRPAVARRLAFRAARGGGRKRTARPPTSRRQPTPTPCRRGPRRHAIAPPRHG
jgi:hypothetical protein